MGLPLHQIYELRLILAFMFQYDRVSALQLAALLYKQYLYCLDDLNAIDRHILGHRSHHALHSYGHM